MNLKFIGAALLLASFTQQVSAEVIELNLNNVVTLRGPIDDSMAGPLIAKINVKADSRTTLLGNPAPLYLFLDSPGGSVSSGLDIIANTENIPNLKTATIFAASMASGIVQALPGERLGTKNSIMMFHRARGGVQGQLETGELESQLDFWKGIIRKMEKNNSDRMSITLENYKAQVKDELWIHGQDNITKKSLDRIVSFKCSKELLNATETLQVNTMFGPITLKFSQCPLLNYPIGIEGGQEAQTIFNKAYNEISKKFSFGNRF